MDEPIPKESKDSNDWAHELLRVHLGDDLLVAPAVAPFEAVASSDVDVIIRELEEEFREVMPKLSLDEEDFLPGGERLSGAFF